jgi:hypothetical protein
MPALPGYGTDTDVMIATANRVFDVVSQLRTTAATMSNQLMAELNDATFVGAAATTFGNDGQGVHGLVRKDMEDLNAALERLTVLVQEATNEYLQSDDAGQSAVARSGATAGTSTSALNWG